MKQSLIWIMALAASATFTLTVHAKVTPPTGTITTVGEQKFVGTFKWFQSSKKYTIKTKKLSTEVKLAEVETIDIRKPAELDAAIAKVKAGSAAGAIATLEEIADVYARLTWDQIATRWLVEAYSKTGDTAKATKACEKIIRMDDKAAYQGEFAVAYWRLLISTNKATKLDELLNKAVASGDPYSAAFALVMRGNAAMAKGSAVANCTEALMDGYLRVILLYAGVTEAMPEALYMGAKAFDGRQNASRADKLRKQLKAEYPNSEWAKK